MGKVNYCARIRRQEGIRWPKKGGFRRISDEAVRAKTGKGWEEWYTNWIREVQGRRVTPKALNIFSSTTD